MGKADVGAQTCLDENFQGLGHNSELLSSPITSMSEEQLSALLAKLKQDATLVEKLQGATDLDFAVAIAKEAGFDVTRGDLLKYQAQQSLQLSDEDLERVNGGTVGWIIPLTFALGCFKDKGGQTNQQITDSVT